MSAPTMTAADARREAAQQRAQSLGASGRHPEPAQAPAGAARQLPFEATELRAQLVERDGKQFYRVDGYASVVERGYEMWDFFGPYEEIVDARAFDATLAASPDVAFLVNHKGVTMARTTNGTLELSADSLGLRSTAFLNPDRQDVRDLVSAITDKLITEMSFAFMLNDGAWNESFDQFRIMETDINRGDVSGVNYGANPYTSIAARSREIMRDLDHLPAGAARAALARLQHREDLAPVRAPEPQPSSVRDGGGRKITLIEALLDVD
jgi:HK97 family phage prohead protease